MQDNIKAGFILRGVVALLSLGFTEAVIALLKRRAHRFPLYSDLDDLTASEKAGLINWMNGRSRGQQ